jgi:hypothetical protein
VNDGFAAKPTIKLEMKLTIKFAIKLAAWTISQLFKMGDDEMTSR